MELIALVSALHPEIFSGLWVLAVIVSLLIGAGSLIGKKTIQGSNTSSDGQQHDHFFSAFRGVAKVWIVAFGPLLILSFGSALAFNLKFSRIEVLEVVAGGLILSLGLLRFRPKIDWLIKAAIAGSIIALGVAAFDLLVIQTHRAGLAFHPINYGIAVGALCLVLGTYGIQRFVGVKTDSPSSVSKQLLLAGISAGLIALLFSGSRGPILSVFAVLGIVLLTNWQKQAPNCHTKKLLAAAIGFAAVGFVVMVVRSVIEYQTEPHHSLGLRAQILSETIQQILRAPWFGLGIDQAGQFFTSLGLPTNDVNHAHNSLLNATLEMGVLGGFAFLWLFFYLGRLFYRKRSEPIAQLGLALLGFFFLCAMTQDILSHSFTRKLFAFYLALLIVWIRQPSEAQE